MAHSTLHPSAPPPTPLSLDAVSGPALPTINPAPSATTVLGRSSQCDVVLGDESVSRRHCSISFRDGTWFVTDLGSRHGTHVNAAQLKSEESAPLKHGDMVAVGPWLLRARIGPSSHTAGSSIMPGQRLVTLMDAPPAVGAAAAQGALGRSGGTGFARERVERVHERELAAITQNRLQLLIDVAAAVAGTGDEESLANTIVNAAAKGTGFPRACLLRDDAPAAPPVMHSMVGVPADQLLNRGDTLRIVGEYVPDLPDAAQPPSLDAPTSPQLPNDAASFSRSLIGAARKGEIVRLTSDAPMTAHSIMALGIQTALCVPISTGAGVIGFLYLDARAGEGDGAASARATPAVQSDAAAFCSALAKMYALALSNIARHDLEMRQRELVRDLEAAREAQKLIMPPERGKVGGIRYAMKSRSGRYVAGDLFDVVNLGDNRVAVLLGDVAGKGVPAAILMATAQTHLHITLKTSGDPAKAVSEVNRHICEHMASNKFISLWLGVFDAMAGTLSFVDAGHGHWMLLKKGEEPTRVDSSTGIPLGIDADFVFIADTVPFTADHRLLVYSDGVVEQPGPDGKMFGAERAVEAIAQSTSVEQDVSLLFSAVLNFAQTQSLADDTTVSSIAME